MMIRPRGMTGVALAMTAAMVAAIAACKLGPFQPQITNAPDNFQFQATGVTNLTGTFTYTWSNSGDSATVNQATTVNAGSAMLTVSDHNGAQMYSQSLAANGTFGCAKGVTGTWTIRVAFTNYSGTVNFRVQKAP